MSVNPQDPAPGRTSSIRRQLLRGLAAGASMGVLPRMATAAEGFPSRPITVIVPASPGGLLDVYQRFVDKLAAPFLNGQPIIIENRPGANLLLGADAMARIDRGDGYTLTQALQIQVRMPHLQKVRYDPMRDLTWIICMVTSPFGIAVRADSPLRSFDDLIAAARARPGEISYGTVGFANGGHLLMEEVARLKGVKFNVIPMKGSADVIQAAIGGHVDAMSDSASWAPQVQAGKMRLLVTFGESRLEKFPDVPTARELGVPIVYTSPIGMAGPKNMDPAVVRVLHDAYRRAIEQPAHREILDKFDLIPAYRDTAAFTEEMRASFEREKAMVARLGLKN
ncbi:tripartite tricarboxylate transporter substrate binding protein [Pigmentiphaga sp. NML080357]|uniref:Bug family tripartite tricarboxylate transporter substrate binding protein n=1 Tax=Pigmentiphaga sp. NML080357 TaxID=2008675 RepID=UPI0013031C94|nr:tripartite tricarboxylate transporter substrate binding protein [Pigmentiphaga sp. NML080357]